MATTKSGDSYDANGVAREIQASIDRGDFSPGDQLPTTAELGTQYGVARNTVSRAIVKLKASAVLSGSAGGRTWVRVSPPMSKRHNLRYHEEKRRALQPEEQRRTFGVTESDSKISVHALHEDIHEYDVVTTVPDDVRGILGLAEGDRVLRRVYRRRHTRGAGMGGAVSYLPHELVRGNPELLDARNEPWPGGTMHQLHTVGVELDRIDDHITTSMPTRKEQEEMDIPPGVPVLRIRKVSYSTSGAAVEVADIPIPADRVELIYTTPLERW